MANLPSSCWMALVIFVVCVWLLAKVVKKWG